MVRTRSVSAATLRKPLFELPQEAGHVGAHPVGEFLLAQLVPEMFLGIDLGRIGRQAVAADVFRDRRRALATWELATSTIMTMNSWG